MKDRRRVERRALGSGAPQLGGFGPSSLHDHETGLASKDLFHDRTQHALIRAARTDSRIAVLVIDLGQPTSAGSGLDRRKVSSEVRRHVRPEDTVAWLDDQYLGILVEDVCNWMGAQRMRRRLQVAMPRCRASSVAVSDSSGRIRSWFGDSHAPS